MSAIKIASRYAKALIEFAEQSGKLDKILDDMKSFAEMAKNRDLFLLMKSPIVNADKKKAVFNALFTGKLDEITTNFFEIVLRKGRESHLPQIANEFISQYKAMKGITDVTLTTAVSLPQSELDRIKEALLKSEVTDTEVDIETKVDPEILGGFVLQIGDLLYDASAAHKLKQIRKNFSENKYVSAI